MHTQVQVIIRSHEFVPEGFKIMHGGHLMTVFSARNYFSEETNDAALVLLAYDEDNNLQCKPHKLSHKI